MKWLLGLGFLCGVGAFGWIQMHGMPGGNAARADTTLRKTVHVQRRPFTIWSQLDGYIRSRNAHPIASRLSTKATIVYLAPEGTHVEEGEPLVRFDKLVLEERISDLDKNYVLAQSDLDGLEQAELPLELSELEETRVKKQREIRNQKDILKENRDLRQKGLISEPQLIKQETLLRDMEREARKHEEKIRLTRELVHPARLLRARATAQAASNQLAMARQQLESSEILAPGPGVVVYQPLHMDGEYRTIREGDTVYRNQKFMILADMENLVVQCEVPESKLAEIQAGNLAMITPLAFPGLQLKGEVESVGTMAHTVSGRPAWQKFFTVTIRLDNTDTRLRSGMSVRVQVLAYHEENALVIPRTALQFESRQPYCDRLVDARRRIRSTFRTRAVAAWFGECAVGRNFRRSDGGRCDCASMIQYNDRLPAKANRAPPPVEPA